MTSATEAAGLCPSPWQRGSRHLTSHHFLGGTNVACHPELSQPAIWSLGRGEEWATLWISPEALAEGGRGELSREQPSPKAQGVTRAWQQRACPLLTARRLALKHPLFPFYCCLCYLFAGAGRGRLWSGAAFSEDPIPGRHAASNCTGSHLHLIARRSHLCTLLQQS